MHCFLICLMISNNLVSEIFPLEERQSVNLTGMSDTLKEEQLNFMPTDF